MKETYETTKRPSGLVEAYRPPWTPLPLSTFGDMEEVKRMRTNAALLDFINKRIHISFHILCKQGRLEVLKKDVCASSSSQHLITSYAILSQTLTLHNDYTPISVVQPSSSHRRTLLLLLVCRRTTILHREFRFSCRCTVKFTATCLECYRSL
ncbi:hypothetical protein QVD17_25762 [Tagetes erecta]|uniref:Uncharacterized protein n=1 Tax=Tagetes erecta TaxID=13708 RepID=A0AAD8K5M3_TARER|nr:hypothetical protein QVD17_25762 [Tagetes erecta]